MSVNTKILGSETQVQQIVEALFTLPTEKMTEVHDFVVFLQVRYSQPSSVDVSEAWDEQDLHDDAIAGHIPGSLISPSPEFLESVSAFDRLLPQLLEEYRGRAVAIAQGRVIASGPDKMTVWEQVIAQYGQIPCYIEWVEPDVPRRIRMPSVRIVR